MVALCALEPHKGDMFQVFGWGIVQGVDLNLNYLILITNEPEILDKTTHLVLSSVTLPPSVYMTPNAAEGEVPYVSEGVLVSFGQITKRAKISAKK